MLRMVAPWSTTWIIAVTVALLIPLEMGIYIWADDFVFGSGWIAKIQKFGLLLGLWLIAAWVLGKAPGHRLVMHSDE